MIELQNIRKTYPDGTQALKGLDLAFGDGMLGLLGPNGAGKTTLLSILVLALEPSSGQRRYFGIDDRPRHRGRIRGMIGYLPQELDPVETLSGFEYLQLCGDLRQVPLSGRQLKRRIWALLDAVELSHAAKRRADTYSGGMKRRLGLAQALIHAPRLLVVDEPTAGLDPEERIRFRNLVSDLADEIPVLLSTHIVEDIEATCPRLAVIDRGELLFDGGPGELMHRFEGSLFLLPTEREIPAEAYKVGQRAVEGGEVWNVVCSPRPLAGASPLVPTLEEAAAAFLHVPEEELAPETLEPEASEPNAPT